MDENKTYSKGCNGDCYQGRWCDCDNTPVDIEANRRLQIKEVFFLCAFLTTILTAMYIIIKYSDM